MTKELIIIGGHKITYYDKSTPEINLKNYLDLMANSPGDTIAVHRECLDPNFFDLKTLVAGEMLQKFSTYRKRLIILGDFSNVQSKSLHDFIYESNKYGKIVFVNDLEEAAKILK